MEPWIGVDLDGTLAVYNGWEGIEHIGQPVPAMRDRVVQWLAEGKTVKVFTARVSEPNVAIRVRAALVIRSWCQEHIGQPLEVTCTKDFGMVELYDDRAITVEQNTGRLIGVEQHRFTP